MNLLITFLLLVSFSHARWATKEDALEQGEYTLDIKVKKNGTYSITETREITILKEGAKAKYSLLSVPYNSSSMNLKILEAKVTNGKDVQVVSNEKMVERTPQQSTGISDSKTIQIPFPGVQVGSKIRLKLVREIKQVVLPGHFSLTLGLGGDVYTLADVINIESEIPLTHMKNDPFKILDVSEKTVGEKQFLTYKTTSPYIFHLVGETSFLPYEKTTRLIFSSDKDWSGISKHFHHKYEDILNQTLPKKLEEVAVSAAKLSSDEAKVNYLVGWITSNFNYVGNWQNITGQFIPRNLKEVVDTKYGDCKDFSSLLTVMLRKIGILAHVALVHRSNIPEGRIQKAELPSPLVFNHAIVRVVNREGTFWVDPTNQASSSFKHRSDIAGKIAFTLDGKPILEEIPLPKMEDNTTTIVKTFSLNESDMAEVEAKLHLKGSAAIMFTGMENHIPQDKIKKIVQSIFSQGEEAVLPTFKPFDLKQKVFKDLLFDFKYTGANIVRKNKDEEEVVPLPPIYSLFGGVLFNTDQWVGDQYLGEPQQVIRQFKMKNVFVKEQTDSCNIRSPWLEFQRHLSYGNDDVVLTDILKVKQVFVSQKDFSSADYQQMKNNLIGCMNKTGVLKIQKKEKRHLGLDGVLDEHLSKLTVKERIEKRISLIDVALRSLDAPLSTRQQIYLLRQNIKDNPSHADSYIRLAEEIQLEGGYLDRNATTANTISALNTVTAGLGKVRNDQGLWLKYVYYLYKTNQKEKADALFPKALTVGNIDRYQTYFILSDIYFIRGEVDKALVTIEASKKLAKNDAQKFEMYLHYGVMASQKRDFPLAVKHLAEAEKLWKKGMNNAVYISYSWVLANTRKYDEAVSIAKKGMAIKKNHITETVAFTLTERAKFYLWKKDLLRAKQDIVEALSLFKTSEAYQLVARIEIELKNPERAYELVLEGAQNEKENLTLYYCISAFSFIQGSFPHFEKLIQLSISQAKSVNDKLLALRSHALGLHKAKRRFEMYEVSESAIKFAQSVLPENVGDGRFQFELGGLYMHYGIDADNVELINKAIEHLSKALTLTPDNQDAKSFISNGKQILENIRTGRVPASELNYNLRPRK